MPRLLERMRALWRRREPAPKEVALRPVLNENAAAWPFTEDAVAITPPAPGVYLLYQRGRLIYIGMAVAGSGIRHELEGHRRGVHGGCTRAASAFLYELAADPPATYQRYLSAHRARCGGRLPACNERALSSP